MDLLLYSRYKGIKKMEEEGADGVQATAEFPGLSEVFPIGRLCGRDEEMKRGSAKKTGKRALYY